MSIALEFAYGKSILVLDHYPQQISTSKISYQLYKVLLLLAPFLLIIKFDLVTSFVCKFQYQRPEIPKCCPTL